MRCVTIPGGIVFVEPLCVPVLNDDDNKSGSNKYHLPGFLVKEQHRVNRIVQLNKALKSLELKVNGFKLSNSGEPLDVDVDALTKYLQEMQVEFNALGLLYMEPLETSLTIHKSQPIQLFADIACEHPYSIVVSDYIKVFISGRTNQSINRYDVVDRSIGKKINRLGHTVGRITAQFEASIQVAVFTPDVIATLEPVSNSNWASITDIDQSLGFTFTYQSEVEFREQQTSSSLRTRSTRSTSTHPSASNWDELAVEIACLEEEAKIDEAVSWKLSKESSEHSATTRNDAFLAQFNAISKELTRIKSIASALDQKLFDLLSARDGEKSD